MTHNFTDFQQFLQQNNVWVYWISLYMFQMVFLSIIRSSRLYTQHQVYVVQVSWLLAGGTRWDCFCCVVGGVLISWSCGKWRMVMMHGPINVKFQTVFAIYYKKEKKFHTFAWFFHVHSGDWRYVIYTVMKNRLQT
jgi:hypothetical protein